MQIIQFDNMSSDTLKKKNKLYKIERNKIRSKETRDETKNKNIKA